MGKVRRRRKKEDQNALLRRRESESSMSLLPELLTSPAISRAASIFRSSRKLFVSGRAGRPRSAICFCRGKEKESRARERERGRTPCSA